jgi:hypothetical protein
MHERAGGQSGKGWRDRLAALIAGTAKLAVERLATWKGRQAR